MYNCKTLITTEKEFASHEKRLSICLRPNGFSFSEVSLSEVLLTFGEADGAHAGSMTGVMADLKAFFNAVGIQPLGYHSLQLVILSNESTWVPDELYSPTANHQYLKLVGSDALSIMTAPCPTLASTAVFVASDTLAMAFKVALPGLSVVNQHVRLASMGIEKRSVNHPVLLTHWRNRMVDYAAFRDGRYVFGNTLRCANDNEALFHTVEILKSYGLENADTELLMCGDVDRERFAMLRPYFPLATLFTGTHTSFLNPEFKSLHTYRNALIL
ncbi:MAG: DUF3822 family protein [bacterium]